MEFGQKNYGAQATQSAGGAASMASGAPSRLEMGDDSSKVKMGILGGIVAIFGIGAAVALNGGDEKVAAQQQAQAEREQMMTPTEMAAPAAAPASEMAAAPSATAPAAAGAATAGPGVDPNAVAMAPAPAIEPAAAQPVSEPVASTAAAQVAAVPEPAQQAPQAELAAGPEIAAPAQATAAEAQAPVAKAEPESEPVTKGEQLASSGASEPQAPAVRKPQAVDALDAWWQKSTANTSAFGVQFVGQAADQPSLVIRLSQLADPNVAAQHIKVKAADGSEVATNWQKGANDYVLVNPNLAPGRYTVSIDPGLSSSTGSTLGMALNGPIYIQ